jgi:aminopeptidase-like protein
MYEAYFAACAQFGELAGQTFSPLMPLARRLFPICRSLTGPGVRETLDIIGELVPLTRERVPTGTRCFDWEVPREWSVRDAYVKAPNGERIIDFKKNNLHLVGYSVPVKGRFSRADLEPHLHSLPDRPNVIPYRTSYYHDAWGFCLTHEQRMGLRDGEYEVVVDSTLEPGFLDYAECRLFPERQKEVFLSTYVCHPSMANNELSGPLVVTALMRAIAEVRSARYSYRALFAPETIGAITFLSREAQHLGPRIAAGYVVTCVGDDGPFTLVRSKRGTTLADRAAEHVLTTSLRGDKVDIRGWGPVGSDERQYCSPGFNWPVASLNRSRHGEYAAYHTSADDLDFISEAGLARSVQTYLRVAQTIEMNCRPLRTNPYCEPQLGRRGLYSDLGTDKVDEYVKRILHVLAFADGDNDLIDIANRIGCPIWELLEPLKRLVAAELLTLDFGDGAPT